MNRWLSTFGDQDAAAITPRQIEQIVAPLQSEGKQPATLIRYMTVLKATFNRAIRLGLREQNPTLRVKLSKPNHVLVRYLTAEQENALFEEFPFQYGPVVKTALHTGLRQGELLQLKWQDVDWKVGMLTIHVSRRER